MINIQADMQDLYEIDLALGKMKNKSQIVLRRAINNTAKETVTLLVDEANKEYQFTQTGQVKKTLSIQKATTKNLAALVTSKGRVNELYNFMVKPRTYIRGGGVPGGYGAHTKRGANYQNIFLKQGAASDEDKYRAFVVKYKSGHRTLTQRRPGKRMKSDPSKEFLKTLFAPSIPNILGNEQGVYGVVEPKVYNMLQQNIRTEIENFLNK